MVSLEPLDKSFLPRQWIETMELPFKSKFQFFFSLFFFFVFFSFPFGYVPWIFFLALKDEKWLYFFIMFNYRPFSFNLLKNKKYLNNFLQNQISIQWWLCKNPTPSLLEKTIKTSLKYNKHGRAQLWKKMCIKKITLYHSIVQLSEELLQLKQSITWLVSFFSNKNCL